MKVCYFGSYEQDYPRNQIIIKGLKKNNVNVVECHHISQLRYFRSLSNWLKLTKKHFDLSDYDAMIVGYRYPQYINDIYLAKLLTKITNKPVILDHLISMYDTFVITRKLVKENSIKAKLAYLSDKYSCSLADRAILDSNQRIEYYHKEFKIKKEKFRRVFLGADDELFFPREVTRTENNFLVLFCGTFLPGHGIKHIIEAAKLLENNKDIRFEVIGHGPTFNQNEKLSRKLNLTNISFRGWIDQKKIPDHIARADVILGLFGDVDKVKRAIPTKVYEALAMKKPAITMDCPGVREALSNGKDTILCEMANPEAIAESILSLKEDEQLRKKISENGYKLFKERFCPEVIGGEVKNILDELLVN